MNKYFIVDCYDCVYIMDFKEIEFRMTVLPESTIAYLLREEVTPYLPFELWEYIEEFAYDRTPYQSLNNVNFVFNPAGLLSIPLDDFEYNRCNHMYKNPMLRAVEDSDYDCVRNMMMQATGPNRYPLLSILKHAKKPWMIHLLLNHQTYPPKIYERSLYVFAAQGLDEMINAMGVYRKHISDKIVYHTLMHLMKGIKRRNNPMEQTHSDIKNILANVLRTPIADVLKFISWTDCQPIQ